MPLCRVLGRLRHPARGKPAHYINELRCCRVRFPSAQNKTPDCVSNQGFWNLILTMTYSHMGKPHTTIGDASFHC